MSFPPDQDCSGSTLPHVLCVGLSCLDIINHCDHYPQEDSDVRVEVQKWSSGGNAMNTCKVLSLIGHHCELLATLGGGAETDFVVSEMKKYGIQHSACIYHTQYQLPTSYVVLNTSNGSRTILHYRKLPELSFVQFSEIDISQCSWIHFEGRCVEEYAKMAASVHDYQAISNKKITVSIEIEKTKIQFSNFFTLADVLIVGKDVSRHLGYSTMQEAVVELRKKTNKETVIVCPWGEDGAAAADSSGEVFVCPAYPPNKLADTLGAGDTFNAGLIHFLSQGKSLKSALEFACKVAGAKCGMVGYDGLKDFNH